MISFWRNIYKRKSFLISVFTLYFFSCQSNESSKKVIREIPDSGNLISKEITLAKAALLPSKILLFEDKAVIFDNKKEELFKVYSLPDFSFLYSFGKIGEGPDEFRFVDANSLQRLENNLVVVSSLNMIKVRLGEEGAILGETFDLITSNSEPVNRLLLVNDSIYVSDIFDAIPGAPEHQMTRLGLNEEVTKFGKYPQIPSDNNLPEGSLYREYLKTMVVNPKDGRMAAFYSHQNLIKFYSTKGDLLEEIEVESTLEDYSEEETPMYRVEPYATDEHIYVMYVGKTKKEVEEQFETFRPHLEIWDWEGNLLQRFSFDRPITTFAFSKKFQKLYGLSFFKEDVLFEYDLKEFVISDQGLGKKEKGISTGRDKNTKKQGKAFNAEEKIIAENDFFSIELPAGWDYPSMVTEEEKNPLTAKDGLYSTGGIYVNHKPEDKSFCGVVMEVRVVYPIEELFDVNGYIKSRLDRFRSWTNVNGLSIEEIEIVKGQKGFRIKYSDLPIDPKGIEHIGFNETDIYEKEGRIVEISLSSCTLFEKYYKEVKSAFATIVLKDGFPNQGRKK